MADFALFFAPWGPFCGSQRRAPDDGIVFLLRVIPGISGTHRSGRPREINFISRYICFSQIGPFDVCFEELFSKVQNPGGFFRKIVF